MSGCRPVKQRLKAYALESGFAKMGICRPDSVPEIKDRLAQYVSEERHGQMAWMADRMQWRGDPSKLWPEARTIIMLAEVYSPEHDPLQSLTKGNCAAISVYAQNRDYHDIVKKRLKRVGRWLLEQAPEHEIKVFVDTAPVMEKPLGQAAGLGWQGKHTNLLGRDLGNWFFLGAIFTTLELEPDVPEVSHCGNCTACLDICPTQAFPAPYQLDARRCISYLTIEHHGPIDEALRPAMGNRIYGCDDCLAVCPWNKFAQTASEQRYSARDDLLDPPIAELLGLDDAAFRQRFSGSPIKRIGRNRFTRNVLYAAGNSGDLTLLETVLTLIDDPDDTVRDAAGWAANRLQEGSH